MDSVGTFETGNKDKPILSNGFGNKPQKTAKAAMGRTTIINDQEDNHKVQNKSRADITGI